jgi:hypothetical protein
MAGLAEVHDCFTIAELNLYKALGIPAAGRGGVPWTKGGSTATAVSQSIRREASARAIPVTNAEIALYGTRHQDLDAARLAETMCSCPWETALREAFI